MAAPAITGAKLPRNGLENVTLLGDNFRLRHKTEAKKEAEVAAQAQVAVEATPPAVLSSYTSILGDI